jgi:uncharacterized membrane protein YkvA (DUF1232 family)
MTNLVSAGTNTLSVSARVVIVRFVRIAVLTLLALVSGFVVSPEVLELVGQTGAIIVAAVLVPALASLDKYLREKWQIKQVAKAQALQARLDADRVAAAKAGGAVPTVALHQIVDTGQTAPATDGEIAMGVATRTDYANVVAAPAPKKTRAKKAAAK